MTSTGPNDDGVDASAPGVAEPQNGRASPDAARASVAQLAATTALTGPPAPHPGWELVHPGAFRPEKHFYPRVLNAQIHSMVRFFLSLSTERLIARYCHLNPRADSAALHSIALAQPKYFRWSGADLFHVTTERGIRRVVVVETNSCPSGQKSMPLYEETDEQGGYRQLMERSFMPLLRSRRLITGDLAVIYDKNHMECSGYAAAMADAAGEPVHLVEFKDDSESNLRFEDGVLIVRLPSGESRPIRAAFRYVTQRPWNRIPISTRTLLFNPLIACLAGGRNKAVAAKAYDMYNAELKGTGLSIYTPETIWDVQKSEIPLWVRRLGGFAVIKVPYSNAGQGVYTVTSQEELDAFMETEQRYTRFIVQSLIGNHTWSSEGAAGRLFHVGTVPDKNGQLHVVDLRMMMCAGTEGWRPLAIYGRRARMPLQEKLGSFPSWDMLGTNLSVRHADGSFTTESERLLLMDRKDYNGLGLGLDVLIEGYVQTLLATTAIDRMASQLITGKGQLRTKLFSALNEDHTLMAELLDVDSGVSTSPA